MEILENHYCIFGLHTIMQDGLRFKITSGNFTNEPIKKVRVQVLNQQYAAAERRQCFENVHAHLTVNRSQQYQTIIGFGGAFTGAVSYLINKIPTASQNCIYRLDALFSV